MTGKKGGKVRETYTSATASYDGNMAKDDKKSKQKHDNKNAQEEIEGIFDFKDDDNSSLVAGIDYTKEENFAVKCFVAHKLVERREE